MEKQNCHFLKCLVRPFFIIKLEILSHCAYWIRQLHLAIFSNLGEIDLELQTYRNTHTHQIHELTTICLLVHALSTKEYIMNYKTWATSKLCEKQMAREHHYNYGSI